MSKTIKDLIRDLRTTNEVYVKLSWARVRLHKTDLIDDLKKLPPDAKAPDYVIVTHSWVRSAGTSYERTIQSKHVVLI